VVTVARRCSHAALPCPPLLLRTAGAELANLCREAALGAVREDEEGAREVAARHFAGAQALAVPALTPKLLAEYEAWGARRR